MYLDQLILVLPNAIHRNCESIISGYTAIMTICRIYELYAFQRSC